MFSYTKKYGDEKYLVLVDQLTKTNSVVSKLISKDGCRYRKTKT